MRALLPRWARPTAPAEPFVPADDPVVAVPVLPGLDTVRAWGALLVLGTHVAFWSGGYGFSLTGTLLSRLDVGVALFFVLSGFLLSKPYLAAARKRVPTPGTLHFMWKRLLRIMPPYWLVCVPALALLTDNAGAGPREWLRALALADVYLADEMPAGLTQMWSLATELAFYLLLPLLMWGWNAVTRGRRSDLGVVLLVAATGALSAAWVLLLPDTLAEAAPLALQWLPSYLIWFAVGIGLAHLHEHHTAGSPPGRLPLLDRVVELGRQPGVCLVSAAALMLAASTVLAGPPLLVPATPGQLLTKIALYAAVGGLVVLPVVFAPPGGFQRVMGHRWMRHLGHISYGVFCVHILVLHLITHVTGWPLFQGHGLELLLLTLGISVVLAEGIYWLVERPLSRFRNLGRSRTAATGTAASGTSISH